MFIYWIRKNKKSFRRRWQKKKRKRSAKGKRMRTRVKWKKTTKIAGHRRIVEGIVVEIVTETGIVIKNLSLFNKVFTIYSLYNLNSCIILYIGITGADHAIDVEIAIDQVEREDLLRDHQVKVRRKTMGKIQPKPKSTEKIHHNQKMLYHWCQLKLNRE